MSAHDTTTTERQPDGEKFHDWKTGKWYLYERPAPLTWLWMLRKQVHVEWWNYMSHPWWRSWGDEYEHPKM
jgi:hypothetical protein